MSIEKSTGPFSVAPSQTDQVLVAAVAGRRIRVKFADLQVGGTATTIQFNSKGSGAGTQISELYALGVNEGKVLPSNDSGWFETNTGEALTATTGAGSAVTGQITYSLQQ